MFSDVISTLCWDIWLSFVPEGENGKFEPELSSLSVWINVLYLLIWSYFKVKSSLSRADGSEEEVSERVTVTNLAFKKNWQWNETIFKSWNVREVA